MVGMSITGQHLLRPGRHTVCVKTRFKWRRLLVNPTTRVESTVGEVTTLKVDGLVCSSVCAVRTRGALEQLEGVRRVSVDFDSGVAVIEGPPLAADVYERAVTGAVAGRPIRRMIELLARRISPRRNANFDDIA
jgi:hypothetical protein